MGIITQCLNLRRVRHNVVKCDFNYYIKDACVMKNNRVNNFEMGIVSHEKMFSN